MNRPISLLILVLLAAGIGWWVLHAKRRQAEQKPATTLSDGAYLVYEGTEPGLQMTFEYPSGWRVTEEEGKQDMYRLVRLQGPRNADDTYTLYISVKTEPLESYGGRFSKVDAALNNYTSHLIATSKLIADEPLAVAQQKARRLVHTYTIPPLYQPRLKNIPIPVKTAAVFFEKSPYLYQITFSSDAHQYETYAKTLDRLLKSIRFQ